MVSVNILRTGIAGYWTNWLRKMKLEKSVITLSIEGFKVCMSVRFVAFIKVSSLNLINKKYKVCDTCVT